MKSRFIDVPGLRMHYRKAGNGQPVIAIHGWPETSHEWVRIAPHLEGDMRLLAPDTRGHGATEAPSDGYDRGQLALDIVHLMDALDIDRCPVIAHDWGGIIAVKLAIDHGERVTRLCLLDTICTGWPIFVKYYYWFMDDDRAEQFFAGHAEAFIRSIVGGQSPSLPLPPACPIEFQSPELTAPEHWASDEGLEVYWAPNVRGDASRASCAYYRSMRFYRVVADAAEPNGERYETVSHGTMPRMWSDQAIPDEYLDIAPEDRHKTFEGPTLSLYGEYLPQAAGGTVNQAGLPTEDLSFDSFARHFPNLRARPMSGGHFFIEAEPAETSRQIKAFLNE